MCSNFFLKKRFLVRIPRKCPGRYFAANGALITIATVLATVEILSEECAPMEVKLDSKSLMTGDAMS